MGLLSSLVTAGLGLPAGEAIKLWLQQ